jgi:hypothetical protein
MKYKPVFNMKSIASKGIAATTLILSTALITPIAFAQNYQKITRLGTSQSVCPGGIETAEQLQSFFANNPNAIRQILDDAGWAGNADDLLKAVADGDMTERTYPIGTQFQWSGAKVNSNFIANRFRQWAGSSSFDAFQVNVASDCKIHHIAIPKICCNVSLISIVDDTSAECVTVVDVVDVAEEIAPVTKLGLIPFVGVFAGSETRPRFEPAWNMDKVDSSGIIGVRAGLLKELSTRTSVFGQVSYYDRQGVNTGNIYPDTNFSLDIGAERNLGQNFFVGGGVGAWNIDDSDFRDASLFGHIGGNLGKSNFQWLVEGRLFDSDSATNDSVSDNRMLSAGIRYLIK